MGVYTDGTHLVANSLDELHRFAARIGLKPHWFQAHRLPHYDLTTAKAVLRAIEAGAAVIPTRQVVQIVQRCTD